MLWHKVYIEDFDKAKKDMEDYNEKASKKAKERIENMKK